MNKKVTGVATHDNIAFLPWVFPLAKVSWLCKDVDHFIIFQVFEIFKFYSEIER